MDAVETPTVSLSTLARAMGPTTPTALASLLRGHKYRGLGPILSYRASRAQAIDHFVEHVPLRPDAPLRAHEREAIKALERAKVRLPAWSRPLRPSTRKASWTIGDVRVSMHPDLELDGRIESGAVKFSFAKTPLARDVGRSMTELLWYWRARVLGVPTTRASHCIVVEPRLPWTHLPGKNPAKIIKSAELACKVIAALWPTI